MSFELAVSKLSVATDINGQVPIAKILPKIAEAGFKEVHWCHEWNTDYLYKPTDLRLITLLLNRLKLSVYNLHASEGTALQWLSKDEHDRKKGVELIRNRIEVTYELGGKNVILHLPGSTASLSHSWFWPSLQKSLDDLESVVRNKKVTIAFENLYQDSRYGPSNFSIIEELFNIYPNDFIGLCYDSGHGNVDKAVNGLEKLQKNINRLHAIHLHDNFGKRSTFAGDDDLHMLLFSGTINWEKLASILIKSAYTGPITMEVARKHQSEVSTGIFLEKAFYTGMKFKKLLRQASELNLLFE